MIATLLSPLALKLGGFLLALIGVLGGLFAVRQSGVKAAQNAATKVNLKRAEAANAALSDVARLSDTAVDQRLRSEFSRPD